MGDVIIYNHPLIQHKLTYLRDDTCPSKLFRELVDELSTLMAYELTRNIPVDEKVVRTPLNLEARGKHLGSDRLAVIPILRAGLGMLPGIMRVIPMAAVGHIGVYRDHESLEPIEYYVKLPSRLEERVCIVVDPMLATGGSAVAAVGFLKRKGARRIKFNCILAAPEGIDRLSSTHPDVDIYCAGVDEKLNEQGYIMPGLGDAGDRLFGTR